MSTLTEKVAEQIGACGPQVAERVIAHLVEQEVNRRSEAVIKALSVMDRLSREGRKIVPDLVAYDENGAVLSKNWSKAKLEERKANATKVEKLQKAIDKALEQDDFADLYNAVNNDKPDSNQG
jgi:hypothetical protein